MTQTAGTYVIVSRVHVNQWNTDLQAAIPGWDIRARWTSTGALLPVFVPDDAYTPANVDTLIRAAGAVDDAVHALGG